MKDFILEILSEELPTFEQEAAAHKIKDGIISFIESVDKKSKFDLHSFSTPRRLIILGKVYITQDSTASSTVVGPKTDAPQIAIEGFMRKYSIANKSDMFVVDNKFAYKSQNEMNPEKICVHAINKAISSIKWSKTMKCGESDFRWIRPIRNVLAMLDGSILPLTLGGLSSTNKTRGHRFMSSNEEHTIANSDDYLRTMEKNNVIIDHHERIRIITDESNRLAQENNLQVISDHKLIREIAGLVEYPNPILCRMNPQFLSIPKEIIISTLRLHQKYIMLRDSNDNLAPYFIVVSNIKSNQNSHVREGNEKVLNARLEDAIFSLKQDQKFTIADRLNSLKQLTFHSELGSMFDKSTRIQKLAFSIANLLQVPGRIIKETERAAAICKTDLSSEIVKEFPELQGIMGYYQAINAGESMEVALAIKNHYKPLGPNDSIPNDMRAICISIADKIDTIDSLFSINIRPTGSKDPYALRRAALGIIRIICANKIVINFHAPSLALDRSSIDFIASKLENFNEGYDIKYAELSLQSTQ